MSDTPPKARFFRLSPDTWMPLSFALLIAGGAWTGAGLVASHDRDKLAQSHVNDRVAQQLAELHRRDSDLVSRSELRALLTLLRAQLPPELRNAVPEMSK